MRIKRIIAMALCVVMACFALASCDEGDIGSYRDKYDWEETPVVELSFDLYIITESGDDERAKEAFTTVESRINQYLDGKYDTILDIHYISGEDYASEVADLITSSDDTDDVASSRPNAGAIVLIAGEDMYNSLIEKDALFNLYPFLSDKEYINAFGKLNTQITTTLLNAAKVDEDGETKLYCIPNDHLIGEYEYTVIDREIAEGVLNFSAQTELLEMQIVDGVPNDIAKELIDAVIANYGEDKVDEVIHVETGRFEKKAELEADGKTICNISSYPEVTSEVVFASAFGIMNTDDLYNADGELLIDAMGCAQRAMEVVYSINADSTLRNLLQYGVENTNYKLEEVTETVNGKEITVEYVVPMENNAYKMNLLYTGDMFSAYYCAEDVWSYNGESGAWTYEIMNNADNQNKESVIAK